MPRPYFSYSTDELASVARKNWDSLATLEALRAETTFRSRRQASALQRELDARIGALRALQEVPRVADAPPVPTQPTAGGWLRRLFSPSPTYDEAFYLAKVRTDLVALRDQIRQTSSPAEGFQEFLRDTMIEELILHRPRSHAEYLKRIPFGIRLGSDPEQSQAFLPPALQIISVLK